MSRERATGVPDSAVSALLSDVTFDLLPGEGFETAVSHLPADARIAVVLTPELGVWPTVEKTELVAGQGYDVVPHVAPRFIQDREELDEIAGRLREAGVTDVFVPGGDRDEPVGDLASAYEMLVALEELGYDFAELGIAGYPTGHGSIDDATIREAMDRKAPYATYVVTQLCFDGEAVLDWTERVRDRGVDLPVEVGIPGVMEYRRLMTLARRWGIADPIRFVRKTAGFASFARNLLDSGGRYRPDDMVRTLAPRRTDPHLDIRRLRLYTFNETSATEAWRHEWLDGERTL